MRMDRECDGNENYCAVYVCLSVLVVFPKKCVTEESKKGDIHLLR